MRLCAYMCVLLCVQPSTVHVELPGFLEPGAVPANLVAATAPAEGVLTNTNPLREHEHCPAPTGEWMFFVVTDDSTAAAAAAVDIVFACVPERACECAHRNVLL